MSPDDTAGGGYTTHGEEYYAKQWDLLDEHLSPETARLVKRVIKRGEEQRGWAASTVRNHTRNIRFVISYGVERSDVSDDPTEWTADEWNMLISDIAIERGVGTGQKRGYSTAAKAFIWHCREIPDSLSRQDIESPKQERSPINTDNVLTHEEVMDLIENANNSRDRALIATIYQGGLRRGAAVQINLEDFDDKGDWATVRIPDVDGVKGANGNVKPLTWAKGFVDSWLSDHPEMMKDDPDETAPLFCSVRKQDDGKRITGHSIYTMMKRLADEVDIEDERIHPHMLKHARGTFMRASSNFDKKDIEQVMDWSESTPMHARYSHADQPAEAARVAKKMGAAVDDGDAQPEPTDCTRCGRQVPPAASYCPHCSLKMDDGPPKWFKLYRKITSGDDPVRQKYDDVAAAVPPLQKLSKSEFTHARQTFGETVLRADYADDYPDGISQSDIDFISENWVSSKADLAKNFIENETDYELQDVDDWSLPVDELQREVEERFGEDS